MGESGHLGLYYSLVSLEVREPREWKSLSVEGRGFLLALTFLLIEGAQVLDSETLGYPLYSNCFPIMIGHGSFSKCILGPGLDPCSITFPGESISACPTQAVTN